MSASIGAASGHLLGHHVPIWPHEARWGILVTEIQRDFNVTDRGEAMDRTMRRSMELGQLVDEESGLLERPPGIRVIPWHSPMYPYYAEDGYLRWNRYHPHPVEMDAQMLAQFVALAIAPEERIAAYAGRWGVLRLCPAGSPESSLRHEPCRRYECRERRCTLVEISPDEQQESVDWWRRYAMLARCILLQAAALHQGQLGRVTNLAFIRSWKGAPSIAYGGAHTPLTVHGEAEVTADDEWGVSVPPPPPSSPPFDSFIDAYDDAMHRLPRDGSDSLQEWYDQTIDERHWYDGTDDHYHRLMDWVRWHRGEEFPRDWYLEGFAEALPRLSRATISDAIRQWLELGNVRFDFTWGETDRRYCLRSTGFSALLVFN